MKIERFEVPGLAQYSYVVSANGKAAVIDAIRDFDGYLRYAEENQLTITHVLETHIHADFAAGSKALAAATGAELALSAYDQDELYQYAMPHTHLRHGDDLQIGSVILKAIHTPGHTPEHLSFLAFDTTRSSSDPVALFSGDFLFAGSLGRPDLLGDAATQRLAHMLYRSVHDSLRSLPDSLAIYPGHGAGSFCGSNMSEQADTTLGYERATNELLSLEEDAFLARVLGSLPPLPAYYPRMKRLNAAGAPAFDVLPGGKALSLEKVHALSQQPEVTLLDLRRPEAFGGAHIPGSINIGDGQNLSLWAGWLFDPSNAIVLLGDGSSEENTRRALVRVGLDNILGYLAKGVPAWLEAGYTFARTQQVSVAEVLDRLSTSRVLDVREDNEWNAGHIAGAQHISLGSLSLHIEDLPKTPPVVSVCGSGYRSSIAASLLAARGFTEVSSMTGGMTAWKKQHAPLA